MEIFIAHFIYSLYLLFSPEISLVSQGWIQDFSRWGGCFFGTAESMGHAPQSVVIRELKTVSLKNTSNAIK